jgi:hypothetical protein
VKTETLAVELGTEFRTGEHSAEHDINGESAAITIERRG